MTPQDFHVSGLVVDSTTNMPLPGIRVVVHDPEVALLDVMMVGTTGADGRFTVVVRPGAARRMLQGPLQDVSSETSATEFFFFNGDTKIDQTVMDVSMGDLSAGEFRAPMRIRFAGQSALSFLVRGRVVDGDGRSIPGATVDVLDVVVGGQTSLGTSTTDPNGEYTVTYSGSGSSVTGDPKKDVRVRVTDCASVELAMSRVVFGVQANQTIDVVAIDPLEAYAGPTEYERLSRALSPHLGVIAVADLDAESLELLAKRADVFPPHLGMFVQAARLARGRGTTPESMYALLRADLPPALSGLAHAGAVALASALQAGYAGRVVPTPAEPTATVALVVAELAGLRVDAAMLPGDGSTASVRDALDTSGLAPAVLRTFVEAWDAHEGTKPEFFAALVTNPDLSADQPQVLEFTVRAAALTQNFLPALVALQRERVSGSVATVEDLAAWDEPEWIALLTPTGAPVGIVGDTPAERVQQYARALNRTIELEYPTRVLARRLQRDNPPSAAGVQPFLDANADFDIRRSAVGAYLAEHARTVDPATRANLEQVQRVYAVAPKRDAYNVTRVLLEAGIGSAAEIARMGAPSFVARMAEGFAILDPTVPGDQLARVVYDNAAARNAVSVAMVAQYGAARNAVHIDATQVLWPTVNAAAGATLENLFGNQDYCACEHCKSQFGPGAYLVDLLAQLSAAPAVSQDSALEVLRSRRGDIPQLDLSCANANTLLPYIDLVLELLEQRALGQSPLVANQTTWASDVLRVQPEHSNDDAYESTASYEGPDTAVAPWSLPFHLPTVEARASMTALGVARAEVVETLRRQGVAPAAGLVATPEEADVVAEKLTMTRLELQIVTGSTAYETTLVGTTSVASAWGVANAGQIPTSMGPVLASSGLDFADIETLVTLRYISPSANPVSIQYVNDEPTCDLARIYLDNFSLGEADRLHRFVRLSRVVPMSVGELDIAIETFGGGVLDFAVVRQTVALVEVSSRLGLGIEECCALWADLTRVGVGGQPSLYDRLFGDRRVDGGIDADFARSDGQVGLPPVGEPMVHNAPIADHREAIRGALRLSDRDLDRLTEDLGVTAVTIAGLSMLFRHSRLARAMGLEIDAALRLWRLLDVDPFSDAVQTLAYLDRADEVAQSPMSASEVDYICRHQRAPDSELGLTAEQVSTVFAEIDAGQAEVDARLDALVGTDNVTQTRAHLEVVVGEPTAIHRILARLASATAWDAAQQAELQAWLEGVVEFPAASVAAMVAGLPVPSSPEANLDRRCGLLNPDLARYRRAREMDSVLSEVLGELGGVSRAAALELAAARLTESGVSVRDGLVDPLANFRRAALLRFYKATVLVAGLKIERSDFDWYFTTPAQPQSMDLNALPLVAVTDGGGRFAQWRALAMGVRLRAAMSGGPSGGNPLRAAADAAVAAGTVAAAVDVLSLSSVWSTADVTWAVGAEFLDLAPGDFADPWALARVSDAVSLGLRTGVGLGDLASWARGVPDAAAARVMKQAVRSRYGEAQWMATMTPVSDGIREAKRDALVDLLTANGTFSSVSAIYDALLVDSQMNACTLTSRLKLAISACQLFVQRGLLGLESAEVRFPEGAAALWERSKNYRVWEAIRRVFFYPENWIEPELRKDATPFFKELQSELDQGDLGEDTIERAFRNYLFRLDEVAQLEIVSIYQELGPGQQHALGTTVHVVGRTRSDPKKYFYRKRERDAVWTAWLPVEHEIGGDHCAVVEFNGRVFLFWAELGAQASNGGFRVRLSWSELRPSGWSAPRFVKGREQGVADGRTMTLMARGGSTLSVHILEQPKNASTAFVTWKFKYDVCLDSLVEWGGVEPGSAVPWGMPASRTVDFQRQEAVGEGELTMIYDGELAQVQVLTSVGGRFHVTQSYQDEVYTGRTAAVFEHGRRALYMVPYGDFVLFPVGIAAPSPGSVTTGTSAIPAFTGDGIDTPAPWGGQTPGAASLGLTDAIAGDPALALDRAVATPSAAPQMQAIASASSPVTAASFPDRRYRLDNFSHPFTCAMLRNLSKRGVPGVLAATGSFRRQQASARYLQAPGTGGDFAPGPAALLWTDPKHEFDFRFGSAYGQYNWELFFHVPLLIADKYRKEQRFEDAARWFHYIFDPQQGQVPGDPSTAARFWNIQPLFGEADNGADDIIQQIFSDEGLDVDSGATQSFVASVAQWLLDPLDPHGIANVRSGTYRWVVVRKYLDNLIDWADSLFRRDSIESINEATQLYLLAAAILGDKPVRLPAAETEDRNYDDLDLQGLFGGLVAIESFSVGATPPGPGTPPPPPASGPVIADAPAGAPLPDPGAVVGIADPPPTLADLWWYFCLPPNEKLLAYWDTIADRLFKVRNCQNIDGLTRQLALFAAPIDPALLVRASAAGLSLGSVLSDLYAPVPQHRYRVLAARALDVCSDVKALGAALLSALEKRDAETLAQLRSQHEIALYNRTKDLREAQIEEATAQLDVLATQRATVEARRDFFANRTRVSAREKQHRKALWIAMGLDIGGAAAKIIGAAVKAASADKNKVAESMIAVAETFSIGSNISRTVGQQILTQAGYERRAEDWTHQAEQAKSEIENIEAQRAAAEIRVALAERELRNAGRQINESEATYAFMRSKYTNTQLYDWMVGQLSSLHFQSYKLAFDLARQAERAMQRELHVDDRFIGFDAWNSLKKGLFAGERLQLDLRRMEAAYLAKNTREYELTKSVSLRAVDAGALVDLQQDGVCVFELPEVLFDLDHPGHYLRRIKSVTMSIPAVVGPHTSVGARLILEQHRVRIDAAVGDGYAETADDTRFEYAYGGVQAIATSQPKDDSGMFQLNHNDERYLPFERAGVVGRWRVELPGAPGAPQLRQFDYASISDVELTIAYTAREGGGPLRQAAEADMTARLDTAAAAAFSAAQQPEGVTMLLQASKDFGVDWDRFVRPTGPAQTTLALPIVRDRFAHVFRDPGVRVTTTGVEVLLVGQNGTQPFGGGPQVVTLTPPTGGALPVVNLAVDGQLARGSTDPDPEVTVTDTMWSLDLSGLSVADPEALQDLIVVVRFSVTVNP